MGKTWLWALVALLGMGSAGAAEYGYPLSLRLGAGVSPADPTESFPYCFQFQSRYVPGSAGGSIFRTTLVKSRRDFLRELNVSVSAAGKYAFFSGSASGSIDEKYSFSSDSTTWMVYFQSDLGRKEIFGEKLEKEYSTLLTSNRHAEFATRCGTELITQERRQASIAAVFSISNLSAEQKSAIESKFAASATMEAWSAEASASYRSFVEEAAKTSNVSLDVVAVGGTGAVDLAPLFTDYGDIQAISKVLREYASRLTFENSKATSYTSTKMDRYGWKGNTLDLSLIDLALSDYYILYRDLDSIKQRAYNLLTQHAEGRILLADADAESMQAVQKTADEVSRSLVKTANACRVSVKDCVPSTDFKLPRPSWPRVDPVGTVLQTRKSVDCKIAPTPIAADVRFLCDQSATYLAVARWAEVGTVEATDRLGQTLSPNIQPTIALQQAYEHAKSIWNKDLTETQFLRLVIGERLETIDAAIARGWGARYIDVRHVYGSQSANTSLRTTLVLNFIGTNGARYQRQVFMY